MLNLVFKDLLNLKKVIWLPLVYGFILLYAFHTMEEAALIGVTIAVNYMFMLQTCGYDDKNRSDILLLSLPLSRKTVVGAKYLSAFLYAILGLLTYVVAWGIYHWFIVSFPLPALTPALVFVGFALAMMLSSVYYPVYFKFGHLKSNIYGIVIFMLFTFLPSILLGIFRRGSENLILARFVQVVKPWLAASPNRPVVILIMTALLLFALSYRLSLRFYEKREF